MTTSTATPTPPAAKKPVLVRCAICGALNRVDLARLGDKPKCAKCKKPLALDRPQKVTDADFQQIVEGASVPAVVDFYADWCGPCKIMAPAVDQLASENQGKLLVAKLDTDRSPQTAQSFGIRGIPTVIVFEHGKEARRSSGAMPLRGLQQLAGVSR